MAIYMGWRKGQRNPVPARCRKCIFRPGTDSSLSRFYCWAGVPSMADAEACGKKRTRPKKSPDEKDAVSCLE